MVKAVYMAAIVGLGGALGLGFGWLIWGRTKAPDIIVTALLDERCLPFVQGAAPNTDGLVEMNIANETGYVERNRNVAVIFGTRFNRPVCEISDILAGWSKIERDAVLKATRDFAVRHIAPLNDGMLVEVDVSLENLGEPQIVWRRPDMETGYFAGFTHTPAPQGYQKTSVQLGISKFIRPAQITEGTDA